MRERKRLSLITRNRITRFCRNILDYLGGGNIGFADIGSGGDLKEPWALLPTERLTVYHFEPTHSNGQGRPLCISDKTGTAPFYVAHDERASSLHKPLADFIDRFRFNSMLTKEILTVDCLPLDDYFTGRYELVDALDINVEGHDFQVLQGACKLLAAGAVKLLKVEFELVPVYESQGYFSDIDVFLRVRNFTLANMQVEDARPAKVRHLFAKGESIWGKALYVPTQDYRKARLDYILKTGGRQTARRELASTVALYAASRLVGHVYDAIEHAETAAVITGFEGQQVRAQIDDAFRWARVEAGLTQLEALATAGFGSFFRRGACG